MSAFVSGRWMLEIDDDNGDATLWDFDFPIKSFTIKKLTSIARRNINPLNEHDKLESPADNDLLLLYENFLEWVENNPEDSR
jgi:hypothetical protein